MPRIKMSVARLKRKRRILGQAKGYFGRRKNLHKTAKDSQKHLDMGFHDGWGTAIGQLAALVE